MRHGTPAGGKPGIPALAAGNLAVLLVLLGAIFAGGEVYYRTIADTTDSFGTMRLSEDWFERHYRRNRSGFRDSVDAYPLERAGGRRRVTFIGDSFTAGHGIADVERRFANVIRRSHPGWEVHVAAELGFETGDELRLAADLARSGYEFDLVVLVYTPNDIADLVPEWGQFVKRLYGEPPRGWLVRHSYLVNTWYHRIRNARRPEISGYGQTLAAAYDGPAWERQQARLAELHAVIRNAGGRLVAVAFPLLHHLGPGYEFRRAHARLGALWAGEGVPHLDLLGAFDARAGERWVLHRHDAHPNAAAHALAAGLIGDFVAAELRRPEPSGTASRSAPRTAP